MLIATTSEDFKGVFQNNVAENLMSVLLLVQSLKDWKSLPCHDLGVRLSSLMRKTLSVEFID